MGFSYKRSKRVGEQIIREVSDMLTKSEIRDPRLKSVALTNFSISDDMGYLKLYFTKLDEKADIDEIKKGLDSAGSYIRKKVAQNLRMKKTPKIEFEFDTVLENGYRIDELLRDIDSEPDQ